MPPPFRQRVVARPEVVPALRRRVVDYLRELGVADDHLRAAIALALTEATANVVRHAYPDREGEVEVEVARHDSHVAVVVRDDGVGVTGASRAPGLGLGMQIIAREATECAVSTTPSGTTVSMSFALPA